MCSSSQPMFECRDFLVMFSYSREHITSFIYKRVMMMRKKTKILVINHRGDLQHLHHLHRKPNNILRQFIVKNNWIDSDTQ